MNWVEIFNETAILLTCYIATSFTNLKGEERDTLGWILIGVAVFNVIGNMGLLVTSTIINVC